MAQTTDDDNAYRLVVRFGERILEAGFTSAPNLFLLHYRDLGLSDAEAMWIVQILRFKWTDQNPYPRQVHLPMSASETSRRRYTRKLRRMGLLFTRRRYYTAATAPRPDLVGKLQSQEYDLGSLFHNLVRLAAWLEAGHAAADFVVELPRDVVDRVAPDPTTGRPYFHDVPANIYERCVAHAAADPAGTEPLLLSGEVRQTLPAAPVEAANEELPGQNDTVEPAFLPGQNDIVEEGSLPCQNDIVEASTMPKSTSSFWHRLKEDTGLKKETTVLLPVPAEPEPDTGFTGVCPPFAPAEDLVDLLRDLGAQEPKLSQVLAGEPAPAAVWSWAAYARVQDSLRNPAGFVLSQLEHRHPPPPEVLALARLDPADWEWLAEHAPARVRQGWWPAGGPVTEDVAEDWLVYCYNVRRTLPGEERTEGASLPACPVLKLPPGVAPLDDLWAAALGQLRLQTTPADYAAWLQDTRLGHRDGTWVLVARDAGAQEWLAHRLTRLIRVTLVGLAGEPGAGERALEIVVAGAGAPGEELEF